MRKRNKRGQSGVTLVEFAASLVFGLPLVVSVLYAVLESNYLFTIRTNLDSAARRACRLEADNYALTGGSTADVATPAIKIPHFVDPGASQFTITFDTTQVPFTVTVTCEYPTAGYGPAGMMPFPWPDPLGLGSSFDIKATATFPILPEK